ncbi:Peroxidase [Rhynchospora pubera]|uniref:Peroxidase n=1 Tax=Rhynchospora pubera TaxID=906938 RepID=A0AAV8G766_9POAL|nr:Peroxidase [Rhynchospora pubera]
MRLSALLICILCSLLFTASRAGDDTNNNNSSAPFAVDIPAYLLPIDGLDFDYYMKTCPGMEGIIANKVKELITKDYTYGASLIRLYFHDCAVRGCDASILLDQPETSEKYAGPSKTLRGFEFINEIKAELEKQCPKTVSCSDILSAVVRDATTAIGGPYWQVKYGRKDGRISRSEEAEAIPMGRESITDLIQYFQSMGLSPVDLVILLGAHTIGYSSCASIRYRLYNYQGPGNCDPTIDPQYANFLTRYCQDPTKKVQLDPTTPTIFDSVYYQNIQKNMGLLEVEQKLFVDSRTAPLVKALANQPDLFYMQFRAAMVKLSKTLVLTKDEGEVRLNCSAVN